MHIYMFKFFSCFFTFLFLVHFISICFICSDHFMIRQICECKIIWLHPKIQRNKQHTASHKIEMLKNIWCSSTCKRLIIIILTCWLIFFLFSNESFKHTCRNWSDVGLCMLLHFYFAKAMRA